MGRRTCPTGGLDGALRDGGRAGQRGVVADGNGAMPDNKSWHLYRRGLGPTLDQLFMQSNFGVVVKMGVC